MTEKKRVKMAHGAGGEAMNELLQEVVLPSLGKANVEVGLEALDDSAVIDGVVFSTDSHTVKPIFFPGGDIGSLSVAGTVNDISVMGARPLALSLGVVLEEGFLFEDVERITKSVAACADKAGVPIATGDTKVVERGALDQIIINTAGIGKRSPWLDGDLEHVLNSRKKRGVQLPPGDPTGWLVDSNVGEGEMIIISGSVGDHGIALHSFREGYELKGDLASDVAALNHMVEAVLEVGGVCAMKDPTRGGLANAINEFSRKSKVGVTINEESIPVKEAVRAACDLLGFDPLEIGNEGKLLMVVIPEKAEEVLAAIKDLPEGRDAAIIGTSTTEIKGVVLETSVGGRRVLEAPIGDPIPRIC